MTSAIPPLVLLDLDGTLTDSAPGIIRSARTAYAALGMAEPTTAQLRSFVGPPLPESFRANGVAEADVLAAIDAYRTEFVAGGMWESEAFPGVLGQLAALREAGLTLAVATSKPEVYARPICERRGITALVDGVYGAPLDHVPSSKAGVIAHALADLGPARVPEPERCLMVGDRHHDVDGAAEHGIACLGVGWGYAEPGELDGAIGIVPAVEDLAATVLAWLGR